MLLIPGERRGNMKYKRAIHELIEKIHSEKALKRIYKFVLYVFTKEVDD